MAEGKESSVSVVVLREAENSAAEFTVHFENGQTHDAAIERLSCTATENGIGKGGRGGEEVELEDCVFMRDDTETVSDSAISIMSYMYML